MDSQAVARYHGGRGVTMTKDNRTFLQRVEDLKPKTTKTPTTARVAPIGSNGNAYVDAAHAAELAELSSCPNGARNDTLNIVALKLAGLPIDRDQLRNDLVQACHINGLIRDDGRKSVDDTIDSAFCKATEDGPRVIPERLVRDLIKEVSRDEFNNANSSKGPDDDEASPLLNFIDGATFILTIPDTIPALWGTGQDVLWAEGESLMIAGPMGLGKTTLAGQLIRAQLGIEPEVLGLPVAPRGGKILYLAMDRPAQIARAFARQFDETHYRELADNFVIWKGPPPADVAKNPLLLTYLAQEAGAETLYVDSLKDAALGLSDDAVGAGYNRARQHALANGIQLAELHHTIKRNATGGAPNHVADVYGSAWLTNGTGSIILLGGEPGDPIVSFKHPRQPANEVGPFQLLHDQAAGVITVHHAVDLLDMAAHCGPEGLTAKTAAAALFDMDRPTNGQIEKARRKLNRLADLGKLVCCDGVKGARGAAPATWYPAGGQA
jgi:AAA domain